MPPSSGLCIELISANSSLKESGAKATRISPTISLEVGRLYSIIRPEDVSATDAALIRSLPELRASTHVLIDSHAVNREEYGYRVTHYSFDDLRRIAFDAVVITYCDPDVWRERWTTSPQGRRELSRFEVQHFMALQEAVGIQYAIACGCRCFMLDTSTQAAVALTDWMRDIILGIGGVLDT